MFIKRKVPWYQWSFSLAGLLATILFAWMAWDAFTRPDGSLTERIFSVLLFLLLAASVAVMEWRGRTFSALFRPRKHNSVKPDSHEP